MKRKRRIKARDVKLRKVLWRLERGEIVKIPLREQNIIANICRAFGRENVLIAYDRLLKIYLVSVIDEERLLRYTRKILKRPPIITIGTTS